jgi:hypothetical protein
VRLGTDKKPLLLTFHFEAMNVCNTFSAIRDDEETLGMAACRVARFLGTTYQNGKITKLQHNVTIGHIYQLA